MRRTCGAGIGVALACAPAWRRRPDLRPPAPAPAADAPGYVDWSGPIWDRGQRRRLVRQLPLRASTVGGESIPAFQSGDSTRRSDAGRTATTAVGGLFGGYNWQAGPYLYGLEADLYGANLKRPVPSNAVGFGYEGGRSALQPGPRQDRPLRRPQGPPRLRIRELPRLRHLRPRRRRCAGARHLSGPRRRRGGDGAQGSLLPRLHPRGRRAIRHHPEPRSRPRLPLRRPRALGRFGLGAVPGLGPVSTEVAFSSHQMMARLSWYPGGLRLPAEVAEDTPASPRHRALLVPRPDTLRQSRRAGLPRALSRREQPGAEPVQSTTDRDPCSSA